jgi:hypothetical protein
MTALADQFRLKPSPYASNLLLWIGGTFLSLVVIFCKETHPPMLIASVAGSLESTQSISREYYLANKKSAVPDWTSLRAIENVF